MLRQARSIDRTQHEWAVVLAGGDGVRLKPLTRKICGDERPKQFCPLLRGITLLEETQRRVALQFSVARTLYVVNRSHEVYYAPLLSDVPMTNLVVQSRNRGTAPAILYSLLRIAAVDPDAIVALFPSDHYVSDNHEFMTQVHTALQTARFRPATVILLGLEADSPEVEYGWIEPARPIHKVRRIFNVRRFWEKPNKLQAQVLQLRGCLWNSFVMISSVRALLDLIEATWPGLYRIMSWLSPNVGKPEEAVLSSHIYDWIEETNFSHAVLACHPERLAVLKVSGVRWNDLGEPGRVMAWLQAMERSPDWVDTAAAASNQD